MNKGQPVNAEMARARAQNDVLKLIARRCSEITGMLSGGTSSLGWKRVAKAVDMRGEAFAARLR